MSSWKECKLGDVLELKYGKDHKSLNDGNIPVFGSGGIMRYADTSLYNDESILIPRKGTLNNIFYINKPFWTVDTIFWSKINKKEAFGKFLFYQLKTIDFANLNVGSAVPSLTTKILNEIDIFLPPLEEQKAIAEVLSSLDDKIDLLHRQNQTLESLAQTLFRQWFIEEAKEEWEEKTLSYFGDIICGKTPSKSNSQYFDGNVPFIKIPDMHGNTFIFKTTDTLSEIGKESQKNKTLPPKSICVSCIATVGLVSMNIIESQTNQQINSIIPNKDIYRYFIYLFMQSSYDLLHAMASGGTATLNLNTGDFSKMEILKPDDETLKIFHQVIEPTFDKIFINSKQIQTLENLRDTLLPKLLSGEVRVKI
ncbi:restriction endonuclease subunit S [Aliarcobacter butzleri]|uniref:restriction endonuclease subunit S n=1 Tax=Aliarcobacter butzleri TaxID=28197 RepID=UPI003BB21A8F